MDGTDLRIYCPPPLFTLSYWETAMLAEDGTFDCLKKWFSHKFRGYGIKYELGINMVTGEIVWMNGPFRGATPDISICRSGLLKVLPVVERVLADKGYIGELQIVTPEKNRIDHPEDADLNRHRQLVERVIGRIKFFRICEAKYRGDLNKHQTLMNVICRLCNLMMLEEEPMRAPN